jgi:hypothetical protein
MMRNMVFSKIDYFQLVPVFDMPFAEAFKIHKCRNRFGCMAGYIQLKPPFTPLLFRIPSDHTQIAPFNLSPNKSVQIGTAKSKQP